MIGLLCLQATKPKGMINLIVKWGNIQAITCVKTVLQVAQGTLVSIAGYFCSTCLKISHNHDIGQNWSYRVYRLLAIFRINRNIEIEEIIENSSKLRWYCSAIASKNCHFIYFKTNGGWSKTGCPHHTVSRIINSPLSCCARNTQPVATCIRDNITNQSHWR